MTVLGFSAWRYQSADPEPRISWPELPGVLQHSQDAYEQLGKGHPARRSGGSFNCDESTYCAVLSQPFNLLLEFTQKNRNGLERLPRFRFPPQTLATLCACLVVAGTRWSLGFPFRCQCSGLRDLVRGHLSFCHLALCGCKFIALRSS
jgi:hypothetical protein